MKRTVATFLVLTSLSSVHSCGGGGGSSAALQAGEFYGDVELTLSKASSLDCVEIIGSSFDRQHISIFQ